MQIEISIKGKKNQAAANPFPAKSSRAAFVMRHRKIWGLALIIGELHPRIPNSGDRAIAIKR
jgi:hypothetical protein